MRTVSRTGLVSAGLGLGAVGGFVGSLLRERSALTAARDAAGEESEELPSWGSRLAPLTLDNLQDLPKRCRACVFWELDPVSGQAAVKAGTPELEKEAWISAVLLEWGSCGRVVYVDDVLSGFRALRAARLCAAGDGLPHEPGLP